MGALTFVSSPFVLKRAGIAGEEPIRIANILDKTGGLNIYSLKQVEAVAMAVDEINSEGGLLGRPLELIFYDAQSSNQLYSQYARRALIRDGAQVIHAGVTSSSREVMRPIMHRYGGLLFYNSMYEGGVCDKRHVCLAQVPAQQLKPLVPVVVEAYGKRAYILGADYIYPRTTSKWIQKYTREAGGDVLEEEFFPLDVSDFSSVIARIQESKPDVVWSILVGSAHNAFYRQYEAQIGKDNIPLASAMFGIGREQTYLSPDEAVGIMNSTPFHDNLPTERAQAFVRKFKEYTGEDDYVGDYAEYGYRGVNIWANAVRKAGDPSPDAVIEALPGTQFEAPGGLVTVDGQTNHAVMDIHLVRTNRNRSWDHIRTFEQRQPRDTQAVCNLKDNPTDTTQYIIKETEF
jgi:branched-chain amino acid transport system substrate-binding protein